MKGLRGLALTLALATTLVACGADDTSMTPPLDGDVPLDDVAEASVMRDTTSADDEPMTLDGDDVLDASADAGVDAGADTSVDATGGDVPRDVTRDVATDRPADVTRDAGGVETVSVSHAREFRAVWVATVSNINFPSRTGLSASAQQAELVAMLDAMQRLNQNAIVFQVRPEGDALYRSTLEPWSRFLTGRQGGDPGYDPLAYLVDQAHRRSIEVHAWLNPYRARTSTSVTSVAPHLSITNPEAVVTYGTQVWMNPAARVVQDRLANVIRDLVQRYDLDGIHFDDYFYPYPISGTAFPDDDAFNAYRASGGTLTRGDWRRDNVNRMVERVHDTVTMTRADVRFGISPFGIYRPGMPAGISGLDAYNAIYCDPVRWMNQGWVDYLAPQLYWPTTQTAQAYGALIAWWAGITTGGRYIFAGNNLSSLGSSSAWTVEEIGRQVTLTRGQRARNAMGNIFFTIQPFMSNRMGVTDVFRRDFYARPALTPPLSGRRTTTLPTPDVRLTGRTVQLRGAPVRARGWVVYQSVSGAWQVDRVLTATTTSVDLGVGRWAITAVDRYGDESVGVALDVR